MLWAHAIAPSFFAFLTIIFQPTAHVTLHILLTRLEMSESAMHENWQYHLVYLQEKEHDLFKQTVFGNIAWCFTVSLQCDKNEGFVRRSPGVKYIPLSFSFLCLPRQGGSQHRATGFLVLINHIGEFEIVWQGFSCLHIRVAGIYQPFAPITTF